LKSGVGSTNSQELRMTGDETEMFPSIEERIRIIAKVKRKLNVEQNGKLIYLTVSGSHLYGFPSKDSDVDYRGAFLTGTENLLGLLRKPEETVRIKPDIVLNELRKELQLALASNCNVIERINAKPIYRVPEFTEMRRLVNNALSKDGLYRSYRGMASFNYKKFILGGRATYKKYLYVFRGLMAGIYALETGKIQPNLVELNKRFRIKPVDQLIKLKVEGIEEEPVSELIDSGELDSIIGMLFDRIDEAYEKCRMPAKPSREEIEEIDRFLRRLRIEKLGR